MAGEAFAVEERHDAGVDRQSRLELRQLLRIVVQCHGEIGVSRAVVDGEFGQADGIQQAFGDAGGEAVAGKGDQRHAGPERVGRRRVAVIGEAVENEIGKR